MKDNILSYVYGTLFSPVKTFDDVLESSTSKVFEAFCIIIIVSFIQSLGIFDSNSFLYLGVYLVSYIIIAVSSWVFVACIISLLCWVFSKQLNINMILTLTGFSILPWLFMPAISLFKTVGIGGVVLSVFLNLIIWIWTAVLFILAVSKGTNISLGKSIVLIITPFAGAIIVLAWLSGFISNIIFFVNS